MARSKGFITISLLVICLVIAAGTQMLYRWSVSEHERICDDIRTAQLRLLNISLFRLDMVRSLPLGEQVVYEGIFEPQHERVKVISKHSQSEDGLFDHFLIRSAAANHVGAVQQLQQVSMRMPQKQQEFAARYALASPILRGSQYLTQDVYIQASKEEVQVPAVSFLANKGLKALEMDVVLKNGFARQVYYEARAATLSFLRGKTLYGDAVIINHGSIFIGDNCQFPGRVVLFSDGGLITIGRNVKMNQVLIMTPQDVSIGAGCRINGLISAGSIELKGSSAFTADADVVAPFVSVAYVN